MNKILSLNTFFIILLPIFIVSHFTKNSGHNISEKTLYTSFSQSYSTDCGYISELCKAIYIDVFPPPGEAILKITDEENEWEVGYVNFFQDHAIVVRNKRGESYFVTNSKNAYVRKKASNVDISNSIKAIFNLPFDRVINKELTERDLQRVYGLNSKVTTDDGVTNVLLGQSLNVSDSDIFVLNPCAGVYTATVSAYIEELGMPFVSPWESVVDQSLSSCISSEEDICVKSGCADAACVVTAILNHSLVAADPAITNTIKANYLRLLFDLTEDEKNRLEQTGNVDVFQNLFDYVIGADALCDKVAVGNEIVDLLEQGVLSDACNISETPQNMLLGVMNESEFQSSNFQSFYERLGVNTSYIIRKHFEHCDPKMNCILDKILNYGLCNEIATDFEELEGAFDLIYHYDYNCMSHPRSNLLKYVNGCDFSGSQSDYAITIPFPNCFTNPETAVSTCDPYTLQIYNKHFCYNLSSLEMAAMFMHETIHSEFNRWVYVAGNNTQEVKFTVSSELWRQIVLQKYGSDVITNHHELMNVYLVPRLTEDLWALNGETDLSRKEHYKYFVYDLLAPDAQLVSLNYMTQAELDNLKNLSSQVTSNLGCE